MNKITRGLVLGMMILVVSVLTGCAANKSGGVVDTIGGNQGSVATGTIKIGFVGPLTGDIANLGLNIKAAVVVAQNEINNSGGINGQKIQVLFEDGKCDSKEATLAGNKLINIDKVSFIVGGICSGETLAIAPMAEKSKVVLLSPASTNPKITSAGDYIFRLIASDLYQGKFAAEYAYGTLGKKKVAILYTQDEWGMGVKGVFKSRLSELGGTVAIEEGVQKESNDLRTQLAKIKKTAPDLIYAPTHVDNGIALLKQAKELGMSIDILGGDVWDDTQIPQKASSAAEGVKFTIAASQQLPQYFTSEMSKTGDDKNINAYSPRAYDALKVFAYTMAKFGTDVESVKAGLYKLSDYQGIADTYTLDSNGDVAKANFSIKQFKGGKIVEVK